MSHKQAESSSSGDESLDLTSDKFNAFKALYSQKVKVPIPTAPALDNIAKYDSISKRFRGLLPETNPKPKDENESRSDTEAAGPSQSNAETAGPSQSKALPKEEYQRFLPHQQMVPGKPRKPAANLLRRMESAPPPLQRLQQAATGTPRCRVRVVTRDEHGVHGRLEGFVVLFDKHWNLAMADVTEVFYRPAPKRAKDFFLGDPQEVAALSDRLADLGVSQRLPGRGRGRGLVKQEGGAVASAPGVAATATLPDPLRLVPLEELAAGAAHSRAKGRGKRTREQLADWPPLPKVFWRAHGRRQECVRHMNQVMVRGEHVVYVQLLTMAQQDAERRAQQAR